MGMLVIVLLLFGCGGGESTTSQPSNSAPTTAAQATPTSEAVETDEGGANLGDEGGANLGDETYATLELDGATYEFGLGEGTKCEPERLGVLFEARLAHLDQSGQPIGTEGILVVLDHNKQGQTVSLEVDGVAWSAGVGTGAGFPGDDHDIDGSYAEASLTFVSEDGVEADGQLEVNCANG